MSLFYGSFSTATDSAGTRLQGTPGEGVPGPEDRTLEVMHQAGRYDVRGGAAPTVEMLRDGGLNGGLSLAAVHRAGRASASVHGLCVVLDGRLDDRQELAERLGVEATGGPVGDAELVLQAYRRWGDSCAEHLHGQVAWVLWDGENRRLLAARDVFGVRPFFYRWSDGRLLFASQLSQVVAAAGLGESDLDRGFLSDFLISGKGYRDSTPWHGVEALAPAHLLKVDKGRLSRRRYYRFEDAPKLRWEDPRAYAERFRELFRRAVRQRLPRGETVWSDLSGGLDSSSVVSVAALELERDDTAPRDRFRTLSWSDGQIAANDEWKWARAVLEHHGLEGHRLMVGDHGLFEDAYRGAEHWDLPSLELMSHGLHRRMAGMLRSAGVDGVLKGLGAELVVLFAKVPPFQLADHLRRFHWLRFARDLSAWQRRHREPLLPMAWRYGLRPLLRPASAITFRAQAGIPSWIDPGFAERHDMAERAYRAWAPRRFRDVADQYQFEQIQRMRGSLHPGLLHKATDVRTPFLYRPLAELSLRTPWRHRVDVAEDKVLLRGAMRGILPPMVQNRRRLINGNPSIHRALREAWPRIQRILAEGRLAKWGVVDGEALGHALRRAYHGGWTFLPGLMRPVALEAWLTARLEPARTLAPAVAA